ncbi:hypothetical protein AGMMS49992_16320 [Clostridia bacterium]|nr:hypothetical protein AGMMS49992_16320 [Clostridia bacterium]
MNPLPPVSVIVPVYKVEPWLQESIASVQYQTLPCIETFLVDDGSPDRCPALCDDHAVIDPGWIYIIHKRNGRQGSARNEAISIAAGECCYFLDSDDYLCLNAMEACYNAIKDKRLDIVNLSSFWFNESDDTPPVLKQWFSVPTYPLPDKTLPLLEHQSEHADYALAMFSVFIRMDFLKRSGVCFSETIIFEDALFIKELFLLNGHVGYVSEYLHFYRRRRGSTMTSQRDTSFAFLSNCITFCWLFADYLKATVGKEYLSDYLRYSMHRMTESFLKLKTNPELVFAFRSVVRLYNAMQQNQHSIQDAIRRHLSLYI